MARESYKYENGKFIKVEQADRDELDNKTNIVIKSPTHVKIIEDDAYLARREKLFNQPGFKREKRTKLRENVKAEIEIKMNKMLETLGDKNIQRRLECGEVPAELNSYAKQFKATLKDADTYSIDVGESNIKEFKVARS